MPLSYYVIVRLARLFPIDPHLAIRIPSLVGYVSTLLGVYWFARRRLTPLAALTAALLVILSPFRGYAIEARSYSLLVGSLALCAVLWQRIGEKRFTSFLFAFCLILAVSLHHLAIAAIVVFGIAEAVSTIVSRRIRLSVWVAFVVATCPFVLALPTLLHFRTQFGEYFWSKPTWMTTVETYETYLGVSEKLAFAIIVCFGLLLASSLVQSLRTPPETYRLRNFSAPETVLIASLLCYPILLVALAKLSGSAYVPRYGWPAIIGLAWALIDIIASHVRAVACLAATLLISCGVAGCYDLNALAQEDTAQRWAPLHLASQNRPDMAVVIGSGLLYMEASEYAPAQVHERLVEVVSPSMAASVSHMDTVDKANMLLAHFVPLHLEDLASFEAGKQKFILCSGGIEDWLTQYLIDNNYQLMKLPNGHPVDYSLYLVER
jgi:hypothetical protein